MRIFTFFLLLFSAQLHAQDKISNLTLPSIQNTIDIFQHLDQLREISVQHHMTSSAERQPFLTFAHDLKKNLKAGGYNLFDQDLEEIFDYNFIVLQKSDMIFAFLFGASHRHMDVITNDKWQPIEGFDGLARSGVYEFYQKQHPVLIRKIKDCMLRNGLTEETTKLYIIGHSMGGALSALTTLHLPREFPNLNFQENIKTIIFGSIPVFDEVLGNYYDELFKTNTLNIIHEKEPYWPFFVPINDDLKDSFKAKHIGLHIIAPEPNKHHIIQGYAKSLNKMNTALYEVSEDSFTLQLK